MLESVSDCYKNQQMCDEAIDNYPYVLKFVPDCYMMQKMCDKAVNTYHSTKQFLDAIRLTKCVIKLLIDVILHLFIFLSDIKPVLEIRMIRTMGFEGGGSLMRIQEQNRKKIINLENFKRSVWTKIFTVLFCCERGALGFEKENSTTVYQLPH